MTVSIQRAGVGDAVLGWLGKKRAWKMPHQNGPYDYLKARPESFFAALLRPAEAPLPQGYFYPDEWSPEGSSAEK